MKYMRDNIEDKYGIVTLQDKILEIAVYIDSFCEQYDIDYCLMGGSALGAKRHGGFIPWDDDLDVFMTPDNYEKFRDNFIEHGDKNRFYLQEYGKTKKGYVTVPKLRINGTEYLEELTRDWKMHQGVYVDIFILHNCPDNRISRAWQYFWAKCVVVKGLSMRGYNRQCGIKQLLVNFSRFLPKKVMVDFALAQVYRYRDKKSACYCNFLGKAGLKNGLYKKEWFTEMKSIPFEKITLKVPIGLEEFLVQRFGDYMQIPSDEKIKREQHACKWSVDEDFRVTHQLSGDNFIDEKKLV